MAQKTVVTLIDDLDESEADQTVEFALDGVAYEIDLCEANAKGLRDGVAEFVAHARRTSGRPAARGRAARAGTRPRRTSTPSVDREQNTAIREWARARGYEVGDRGRIPSSIVEAFHQQGARVPAGAATVGRAGPASESPVPAAPAATVVSGAAAPGAGAHGVVGPDGLGSREREQIRAWAQGEGIEVKPRGRLTRDLIANYRATTARAAR